MARFRFLLFAFLCALSPALSLDVNGQIQWNDVCPGFEELRTSKVVLDNGRMKGSIMHDGRFVIPNVPVGTYVLSVVSPNHSFDQLRVDVTNLDTPPEIRPYVLGTPLDPPSTVLLSHPIILIPRQSHLYFIPPESFNLVAMFSNPMMLLMVFGGIMMLAMPYLMNNMDPESMEEFKEQHAKVAGLQNAVTSGNLKSGVSALLSGEEATGSSSSAKPINKNRGNGKNKKR